MLRLILIIICGMITSCYYFPLILKSHLWFNTKTIMGALGLGLILYDLSKDRLAINMRTYLRLILYALVVSFVGYVSITLNNTPDNVYATYISSMAVWLCAAYVAVSAIRAVHHQLTFQLIANYIIGVCVFQCVMTLCIEYIPVVKAQVDRIFFMDQVFLENVNRLYGLGAFLDTAGIRYSVALVLTAYLMLEYSRNDSGQFLTWVYVLSFIIIGFVGNMVARTTLVGVVIGLLLVLTYYLFNRRETNVSLRRIFGAFILSAVVAVPFIVHYYNNNVDFKNQMEFGFEGFFNLFKDGQWEVGSNVQLKRMVVWPESLKTWIIGDGYFNNPDAVDPYYIGEYVGGYYKGTDIGYLRFIFYSGVIGLLAFSIFIIKAGELCMKTWPGRNLVFTLIIVVNFIVWLKVSTDLFLVFALFLALPPTLPEEKCN